MTDAWIDITVGVGPGMPQWPGDHTVQLDRVADMGQGDVCNLTVLHMTAHTGTHMDAPLHFIADGQAIDTMPLDATVGPCRVIEIEDPQAITPAELKRHALRPGERVLFKTRNSRARLLHQSRFDPDFVHITAAAAQHLVEVGVRTVGVDYLSVGGYQRDGVACHQVLLGAGLWLIEGLDLEAAEPGDYELICLPLKLLGVEGSPARAILRPTA